MVLRLIFRFSGGWNKNVARYNISNTYIYIYIYGGQIDINNIMKRSVLFIYFLELFNSIFGVG